MVTPVLTAKKIANKLRTNDELYNNEYFKDGLQSIEIYSKAFLDTKGKVRKYLFELHSYDGFAMVKYYPHHLKKVPKKYELRGIKEIGYLLTRTSFLELIFEGALLMRDYLDVNNDSFIGYIGQVDKKDNINKRLVSQRCKIYNILTSSIFKENKYKHSTKEKFKEVNLRLIRKKRSKEPGKLTHLQFENYKKFLSVFEKQPNKLYHMMTDKTKENIIASL